MRATRSCLGPLSVVPAAGPVFPLAAQGTTAIPAGRNRGTLAFGDRVLPSQIRGSPTAEPRLPIAPGRHAGRHDVSPDASRPAR
jgi:hypothetical protein